jgi:hypothetical protein
MDPDKKHIASVYDVIHDVEKEEKITPFLESHLFQLGKSLFTSIVKYIQLERGLTTEYKMNGGWLKPSKLMEVTDTGELTKKKTLKLNN